MKIFLDTNILIDFLTAREPFGPDACAIIRKCAGDNLVRGCFSSLSACDIVYILRNCFDVDELRKQVFALGSILEMLDTRATEVKTALSSDEDDFEDTVQRLCAENNGADVIITRDKYGFTNASIPVMTPTEFLDWQEQDQ